MDLGLAGRVAIVSGGSKGIGLATAEALLAEGCRVCIAARSPDTLEAAREELEAGAPGRVIAVQADMTEAAGVGRVVSEARAAFGPIDIAISNVIGHVIEPDGDGPHAGYFQDVPSAGYRSEFRQLFLSAWYLAREVVPEMKARGWGRICNVGSGVAREPQWELPHILPNTVRPAVAGLYRSLAGELAPFGITVNNILTGSIATRRNLDYFTWLAQERGLELETMLREMYAGFPIPRPGRPEEMARLMVFLCSNQAAAIAGQSIPVSGGRLRHLY
jgi:3-oxoacyl-[acyl-carrier protein] reductase